MFHEFSIPYEFSDLKLPRLDPENAPISIREAERYLDYEPKYIPMSYYMNFRRTGDRQQYSGLFFEKRRALAALLIGEVQEGKGRFLDKIIDVLYSILQETTWTINAHNVYVRDAETYMLPNTRRPIIDLFAAETASALSVAYVLLKPILTDPDYQFLFDLIEDEINERIVTPYINDHFWWMGDGNAFVNNWTTWCTMNMMITFFLMPIDDVKRRKAFRQACYSLDHFLANYGEDGCCNEGAGYYHHAGLCLMNAVSVMNQVTDGKLNHVFENQMIRNIAAFISDMHVKGEWYINYADCSAKPERSGIREFLAGIDTHDERLMSFAATEYEESSVRERYYMDDYNIYFRLLAHSYDREISSYEKKCLPRKDVYYRSNGVVVTERGRYVLAIKGGDNGDSHNHNDVSSVILYKDGEPVLIDVGVEEYTALTFSSRRYEIWTMRSPYHNTLNFEGVEQKPGKEFTSENMEVDFSDSVSVSMNLEKAYGDERVKTYRRSLTFNSDGLSVIEKVDTTLPGILTLMTSKPVSFQSGKLLVGEKAEVSFSVDPEKVETEEFLIDDNNLNVAWGRGNKLYRTRIHISGDFSWKLR